MGVHGDDVVRTIREALAESIAPSQTVVETTPNPESSWPNRDGRHEFEVVGRDWFRAFRVTVEMTGLEDGGSFDFVDPRAWTAEQDRELREEDRRRAVEAERDRLAALPTLEDWTEGRA